MKRNAVLVATVAAGAIGFAASFAFATSYHSHRNPPLQNTGISALAPVDDLESPGTSGRTPDGRTYGPVPTKIGATPDLVLVIGDNGTLGYADSSLLDVGQAESPEEALAMQKKAPSTVRVPVYDKSGVTIIDYFTVQTGQDETGTDR